MSDAFKEEMESINTEVSCPSLALSAASSAWRQGIGRAIADQ